MKSVARNGRAIGMDKRKEIIKTITEYEHEFYCDECGKHLETVHEHNDGWYPDNHLYQVGCWLNGELYVIQKHLCNDCKNTLKQKIAKGLIDMGFSIRGEEE